MYFLLKMGIVMWVFSGVNFHPFLNHDLFQRLPCSPFQKIPFSAAPLSFVKVKVQRCSREHRQPQSRQTTPIQIMELISMIHLQKLPSLKLRYPLKMSHLKKEIKVPTFTVTSKEGYQLASKNWWVEDSPFLLRRNPAGWRSLFQGLWVSP